MAKSSNLTKFFANLNCQFTNRQKHRHRAHGSDAHQSVTKVHDNGTATVSTEGKCRVILHTGKVDEKTGEEIIEIMLELADIHLALHMAGDINHQTYPHPDDEQWAEVLDYEQVYQRENGLLINGKKPRAKRKKSASKLRLAKVG